MGRTVRELAERMREVHREIAQLQAELVHSIGEFDAMQGYELDHYRSTPAWLRGELRLHPRDAAHLVGMARQLRHLPAVDAAFTTGQISHTHVAVIARTARQIGVEHVAASEDTLLSVALDSHPGRLRVAAQHLRYCVDPDGADRDAVKAYEKRELSIASTIGGMVSIQGVLDPPGGSIVLTALDALTPPPREADPRTAGQRRADALVELCRRALDTATLPTVNGEKPHVLVTIPLNTLTGHPTDEPTNRTGTSQPGTGHVTGEPTSRTETGEPAGQPGTGPVTTGPANRTGTRPVIIGPARLTWVGPISATDALLLACDCAIIPAVLNSAGEVLDIGRKSRVWPVAIARAIGLRDQTCRHADCDIPAQHCDIHHRIHWADGGPTNYHNGILACRHHHTQIHKYGVTFRPDGRFTVNRN